MKAEEAKAEKEKNKLEPDYSSSSDVDEVPPADRKSEEGDIQRIKEIVEQHQVPEDYHQRFWY